MEVLLTTPVMRFPINSNALFETSTEPSAFMQEPSMLSIFSDEDLV